MKFTLFLICLLMLAQVAHFSENKPSRSEESSEEICVRHHYHSHPRSKRFLESVKRHRCGEKLLQAVATACSAACNPGSEVDLSTVCCANKCNYQDIRKACCPDKQ